MALLNVQLTFNPASILFDITMKNTVVTFCINLNISTRGSCYSVKRVVEHVQS